MNKEFFQTKFGTKGHVYKFIGTIPDEIVDETQKNRYVAIQFVTDVNNFQLATNAVFMPNYGNIIFVYGDVKYESDLFQFITNLTPDVVEPVVEETPSEG